MCHNVSCVTCHVSHVTCHVSHVMCHFFWTKWWSLSVEGLLSTGPTPSSFEVLFQKWIVGKLYSHWWTKTLFVTEIVGELLKLMKLDGEAPLITDPLTISFNTLRKKKKKKSDMWHMTCDTWHVTHDMWHLTHDMWHVGGGPGVNILSNFQLPSSYGLWFMIFWRLGGKGWRTELINQWVMRLIVEQPRLHRVC